jgi:hypothetical protein
VAGQIIYHLLAASHATAAPWPVVVVVSCMPVAVLGLAAALTHLLRCPPPGRGKRFRPWQVSAPVFTDTESAAADALARSIAGENAFSPNALATKFLPTRAESAKVVAAVTSASNDHGPE